MVDGCFVGSSGPDCCYGILGEQEAARRAGGLMIIIRAFLSLFGIGVLLILIFAVCVFATMK